MSTTRTHAVSLDPLGFPLRGRHLIEASAGTGKTYTIAALYVRLVLGHDGASAALGEGSVAEAGLGFPRALMPPEILVVTFTDAATKELRERIRARLAQAAAFFRADPASAVDCGDDFLDRLRAGEPAARWPAHARALELAAEWMDEAAVSTIHAWCKRMLSEHAFDSGSLFTQTLETDQREQLAEVVRDYWRSFMLPLAAVEAAEVVQWWPAPEALGKAAGKLLAHLDALPAVDEPAVELGRSLAARVAALAALKAPWGGWADSLQALLDEAVAARLVDGRVIQARRYQPWFDALRSWAADPAALLPALTESAWSRLTPEGLAAGWKGGTPPDHPALAALAALPGQVAALPDARAAVTVHAARWIAARFAEAQRRRASMGFDDLLRQLDAALTGPQGKALARRIREAFPVALIDEFQDTDPVQYRIFDAVYRPRSAAGETGEGDGETALVLIGDPKQAIYAFRGADIHTYLAARRDCAGHLHTLLRNFRSSHAMVEAVNRCFRHAELRAEGAGAFLFRASGDNPVPFVDAVANGRADQLRIDGIAPAALTLWWLAPPAPDKPLGKAESMSRMAAGCASELVRLLALGRAGRAGFARADGGFTPLRPADVAVLVNDRSEAQAIRGALAARGVRSVYLSDRDSVFDSPQADDVQHWLAACAEPEDAHLLRAALATATLSLDWGALDRISHDELAWEAHVERFRRYREIWRRQGVLPMLRRLLHDYAVPARCLARTDGRDGDAGGGAGGERVLTDVLHLAELLQQASSALDGEHALIRHLAEQRTSQGGPGGSGDVRQLRLESDAGLVQVITVHKSKGLEYPLVFLPFAATAREVGPKDVPIKFHDAEGRLQLVLQPDEGARARADRERLGEDLRKLYVALTRARHASWAGVAPTAELARSAFGYLLDAAGEIPPDQLEARLLELAGDCTAIRVEAAPVPDAARLPQHDAEDRPCPARSPRRAVRAHWWIASYSALRYDAADGSAVSRAARMVPDTAGEDVFQDSARPPVAPVPASLATAARRPPPGSLHALPRGAEIGTFLHDLLEWAAVTGFAAVAAQPALLRDTIARRAAMRGLEGWINPLAAWLNAFITMPFRLPAGGAGETAPVVFAGLDAAVPEMEFWLPVQAVDSTVIDRLVCAHTLEGATRPVLREDRLNGMLKGFIDLVFEHAGRYYVADYKSNALGADDEAYTTEAMRAAILGHRYELQYVLYLLALHRLLKSRLPDYDYDRHVGGAVYLFLRGLGATSQGLHFERPPRVLIEALDTLFSGAQPKEVA